MRNVITSVAEVAGAGSLVAAGFLVDVALGFGVLGVFLLAFSRAAVRR